MKSYPKVTDMCQSARLRKCGVPLETADMTWRDMGDPYDHSEDTTPMLIGLNYSDALIIYGDRSNPAWSLPSLLALIPTSISVGKTEYFLDFAPYEDKGWGMGYFNANGIKSVRGLTRPSDPIEACVSMIEWLLRNGHKLSLD